MQGFDEIRIENLEIFAHHGVFPEEKVNGQNFYVNATLYTDLRPAGVKDDLTLSTHYGEVSLFIREKMTERAYDLIETAAEKTTEAVLLQFPLIWAVDFELRKPNAPIPVPFESVSVKIHRGWHKAYIAFGSNMGESLRYIEEAVTALKADVKSRVVKISEIIKTKPYGVQEQADFYNGVLEMDTLYTPGELLEKLHVLEQAAGRERKIHWGPRTLDLDIIFYDRLVYEDDRLCIPHADMQNRDFVIKPMAELAPYFRHPVYGRTMQEMWQQLENRK